MFTIEQARDILTKAELFFGSDMADDDDDQETKDRFAQMLIMSDTWAWGCADGEYVSDEELVEVAKLFWSYGYCGVLYWVSKKRGNERSEFEDINRFVDFVRNEELIREEEPDYDKRAYYKKQYTLG